MSLLHCGAPVVSSSRDSKVRGIYRVVAPSHCQLHAPGVRRASLTSSGKQARGRSFITASAATAPPGISKTDHVRESRRESFPPEILFLEKLVFSLTRSTNFDEKVAFPLRLASLCLFPQITFP